MIQRLAIVCFIFSKKSCDDVTHHFSFVSARYAEDIPLHCQLQLQDSLNGGITGTQILSTQALFRVQRALRICLNT